MVFEHLGLIQMIKQLLGGSHTLTTDVKYKDSKPIDAHPTIITMNSTSKTDILKWHPQELTAFENRCIIYYLGTPLTEFFTAKEISELAQCGSEFLYMLSLYNKDNNNDETKCARQI